MRKKPINMKSFKEKTPCPISQTHTRLNQAYLMFSEVADRYQKPEEFTTSLNNLIQALRNVTFILQAEKSKIPNFDAWYAPLQEKMRQNESLSWLVRARNHVVKKGDLEKESFLSASIRSHYDKVLFSEKFDPFISLEEVAERFRKLIKIKMPKHFEDETILHLERRWVINDFPKTEIIDVLIYCFSQLVEIVFCAHTECCDTGFIECEKNSYLDPEKDFMITLRNDIKKGRIVDILYKSGKTMKPQSITFNPFKDKAPNSDKSFSEVAKERYWIPKEIFALMDSSGENLPFNNVKYHIEMARHLFKVDQRVDTVAFLYFFNKPPMIIQLGMDNPADRYAIMDRLAEQVEETHCTAVVFVGEVWIGNYPKSGEEFVPARYQKDKKEAVSILAASPDKVEEYLMDIERGSEVLPTLGAERLNEGGTFPMLSRIQRVWEYQKTPKDVENSEA